MVFDFKQAYDSGHDARVTPAFNVWIGTSLSGCRQFGPQLMADDGLDNGFDRRRRTIPS